MKTKPTTLEEARKIHYGNTYGAKNPPPNYQEGRCAEQIAKNEGRWTHFYQCQRKNGHGPEGLYCKLHAESFGVTEAEAQIWYRLESGQRGFSGFEVVPVEVARATDSFVWLRVESFNYVKPKEKTYFLRKESKGGNYYLYVPTKEEAKEILSKRIESRRKALAQDELEFKRAIWKLDGI